MNSSPENTSREDTSLEYPTDYAGHDRIYQRRRAEQKPGWDDEYATRFEILDGWLTRDHVPKKGCVLEFGCGAGNISERLAARGYTVTAVDVAPTAIAWARSRLRDTRLEVEFLEADLLDLDQRLEPASFDLVYDSHCFHCIIGSDRARFLQIAHHLLTPNSLLHIETMCGETRHARILQQLDAKSRNLISNGIATRYLGDRDTIQREVEAAGFEIVWSQVLEHEINPDLLLLDARKRECPTS